MKKLGKSIVCGIAALFATTAMAAAPSSIAEYVPLMINYQGYLANPSTGAAYTDGIYDIQCRLWTSASSGTAIWGAQYSVYVKDGYFNIMLGDSAGSALTTSTTYGKDYLWKALMDTSYNALWLGVTPLQGPTHATISSPSEISPRQQLLTAPYAFRAQSSKYAESSLGDFTVNGALTVTGSLNFNANYVTLGNYVKVNDSAKSVVLGGTSSNSSSNPSVSTFASTLSNYSYGKQTFSSYNDGMEFSVPSSKSFNFKTGTFAVTNSNVISLKSNLVNLDGSGYWGVTLLGYPPAKITTDAAVNITGTYGRVQSTYGNEFKSSGYTTITSGGTTDITANNYLNLTAKNAATLKSNNSNVYLEPATNCYVYGQGKVLWKELGATGNIVPFDIGVSTVTIPSGSKSIDTVLLNSSSRNYIVAGVWATSVMNVGVCSCYIYKSGTSQWRVNLKLSGNVTSDATFKVHYMGIHKALSNDNR